MELNDRWMFVHRCGQFVRELEGLSFRDDTVLAMVPEADRRKLDTGELLVRYGAFRDAAVGYVQSRDRAKARSDAAKVHNIQKRFEDIEIRLDKLERGLY